MIGKLQTDVIRSSVITEQQPEQAAQICERPQVETISSTVQQSKLANARKGESMFSTSMQRAILDAALLPSGGTNIEKPTPVGSPPPSVGTAPAGGTERHSLLGYPHLKLNDTGPFVEDLQEDLNRWREMNGLPSIEVSGTFTTETQDAVKEFQRATNLKETGEIEDNTGYRLALEMRPDFQQLNTDVKEKINSAYSALQNDPKGRDNLLDLVDERTFLFVVSPEAQTAAIDSLMINPTSEKIATIKKYGLPDAAILENDPNYDNLPQEIKQKAMNTMFYRMALTGSIGYQNDFRHNTISELFADPVFGKRSLEEQNQLLDIVSANKDIWNSTGSRLNKMLNDPSFQNLSAEMQTQVIDLIHNNVSIANGTGDWPEKDYVENVRDLIQSPAFKALSEEEKAARLEAERKKIYIGDR